MEKKTTLKDMIREAAEHYERHAAHELKHAERFAENSELHNELVNAYHFNRGRAKAMREALEFIEDYIG